MSVLTAQLERLLENAKRTRSDEFQQVIHDHRELFDRYSFRLRPSVGSISLVSCANWTPQLGFSNMNSGSELRTTLAALKEGSMKMKAPDRPTPEKSVQSWLISDALRNDHRLASIESAQNDGHSYWFVSDEIALVAASSDHAVGNERVVADLLVVRVNQGGESELVNIELKSERTTKTHDQIEIFWKFMGPNEFPLWCEFAETMLGRIELPWKAPVESRGIVIWPSSSKPSERTARLMTDYKTKGIDTICYSGPHYSFEAERSA